MCTHEQHNTNTHTQVHEQTKKDLDPKDGGGSIDVTTKYQAHKLKMWTHPHEDCCPMHLVELNNVCVYVCMCVYVCVYVYMCVCVCVYVCVCVSCVPQGLKSREPLPA